MSLASTHRHLKVFGKDTKTCIEANAIVARFALLVLVVASRGCFWLDFWLQELVLTIYIANWVAASHQFCILR